MVDASGNYCFNQIHFLNTQLVLISNFLKRTNVTGQNHKENFYFILSKSKRNFILLTAKTLKLSIFFKTYQQLK